MINCKRQQKGVVATEFALGVLALFAMVFYWIEVSYLGFVNSVVDYAVLEASRGSRYQLHKSESYYDKAFEEILDNVDSVWMQFLDSDQFKREVFYCKSEDLDESSGLEKCNSTLRGAPLGVYRLSYTYQPIVVSFFMPAMEKINIVREVIMVQEHERL